MGTFGLVILNPSGFADLVIKELMKGRNTISSTSTSTSLSTLLLIQHFVLNLYAMVSFSCLIDRTSGLRLSICASNQCANLPHPLRDQYGSGTGTPHWALRPYPATNQNSLMSDDLGRYRTSNLLVTPRNT